MFRRFRALAAALILCAPAPVVAQRPSVPERRGATMDDLFALRELGGMLYEHIALSPTADAVALFERDMDLTTNRYRHRLIVVDMRTGAHRMIAEAGDVILLSSRGRRSGAPLDREPVWSADGRWIYYLAEIEGRVEIWRAAADGSISSPVVVAAGNIRRFILVERGEALVYETETARADIASQRAEEDRRGFRVDEGLTPLYALRPLPDEDGGVEFQWRSIATGETRPATEDERGILLSPPHNPVRPRDPASRVAAPAREVYAVVGGDEIVCAAPKCSGGLEDGWTISALIRDSVVFRRLEGHARSKTALYEWLPGQSFIRLIRRAEDRLEGCVVASGSLICLQDFATQPRRLVRINLSSGAAHVLYDPNQNWDNMRLPRVERLDYTDDSGNESFAHLVYPLNYRRGRRYPLVIVQYRSRGFLNGGTGGETPIFPLSSRGYFVLSVDRPEFRTLETQLSYNELARQTELDDSEHSAKRNAILWFVSELARRRLVDEDRIAITGMSDGAETVFDMLLDAPIFRAAVVSNPPGGPIAYELQSRRFRAERLHGVGLSPPWDEDGAFFNWWQENSPPLRLQRASIDAALLMNLPETEALRAFPFLARVETMPTPIEAYIYPGAYHIKWRPSHIWAARERTVAWLDFWLRDIEPNDIADGARWSAMRERAAQAERASLSPSSSIASQ